MSVSTIPAFVTAHRGEFAALCVRRRIHRLALFGSALADRIGPQSDVGILVEFEPGTRVGLFTIAAIEMELAGLIGRKIGLRTHQDLNRYFREDVVRTAEVLREA
jgi:hypothetical protein